MASVREVTGESRTGFAIAMLVLATMLTPFLDSAAKVLTATLPVLFIVTWRYAFQALVLLPVVITRHRRALWAMPSLRMQLLRSLLIVTSALCFFNALSYAPLADVVAIFFINPFVVTAVAPAVLGERVGVWRWSAVVVGFIGVMFVIRPVFEAVGPGTLFALAAGVLFACFALVSRRLAGQAPPLVAGFLTGLVGAAVFGVTLPWVWTSPTLNEWGLLALAGALGALVHSFLAIAYDNADATTLAPFSYGEMLSAAAVGYVVFRDIPASLSWLGMALIAASGIVIALREARSGRRSSLSAPRPPRR
ncbi:MAG: DMT family transporter [Pseudomonadota bacterium]